jgi:hypothetical protein
MAVTVASLRAAHREFADTDHPTDAEVQAAIDKAERFYSEACLGTLYDDAVELKACQALARSPFARDLRLVKDKGATIFDEELRMIVEPTGRADPERFPA